MNELFYETSKFCYYNLVQNSYNIRYREFKYNFILHISMGFIIHFLCAYTLCKKLLQAAAVASAEVRL
jgi:hypothetical protein